MTVFLSYLLAAVLVGILMRRRPFAHTQVVLALMTGAMAVLYLVLGVI